MKTLHFHLRRSFDSLHAGLVRASHRLSAKTVCWAQVILLVLLLGCASPAYKSLTAVGHAVDTSVNVYFDLVVKGVVRTNDVPKVSQAYNTFQTVFSNAVLMVRLNSKAPPDTNVIAKAGEMLGIVAGAQGKVNP